MKIIRILSHHFTQDGKSVVRGCLGSGNDIKKCEANSECSTCPVDATKPCNSYEFPSERRKCIQCVGSAENDCTAIANPATLYCDSPTDQCVTYQKSGNIKQVCAESLTSAEKQECDDKSAKCLRCSTNNCNKATIKECYSCVGDQCQRTSTALATTTCAADDSCAAVFDGCE